MSQCLIYHVYYFELEFFSWDWFRRIQTGYNVYIPQYWGRKIELGDVIYHEWMMAGFSNANGWTLNKW